MTKVVPLNEQLNPAGARWCEEHNRLECTKQRRRGQGPCHSLAIRGTDACRMHAGIRSELAKAQGEARISAWTPHGSTVGAVSAPMAVLSVLQMSWLRLGSISQILQRQVAKERELAQSPLEDEPEASGYIGFRYGAAGKDGTVYVQSEEVRGLVALEAAERDRVVKYAKVAHDMGISDRLINIAEQWGDVVAGRIVVMLDALNLTPEQSAMVPALIQLHLSSIDMDSMAIAPEKK